MEKKVPRIVIAGTGSGCGKTTVTCGILQALVNRGMSPAAFKCGPDYIDPMFHSRIIGAKSGNLDPFFFSEQTMRYLLAENSAESDLSVIEGVMGFYDGLGMDSFRGSTFEVSEISESPVILTVNARGASLSVLAVISGFLNFTKKNGICGVILNQCTKTTYEMLAEKISSSFEGKVKPLGYLPSLKDCSLESRHLGLVTAGEVKDLKNKMSILASQAEKSLDLDSIVRIAKSAHSLRFEDMEIPRFEEKVRIGIAKDRAFCFYYEDSLDLLRKMGAELVSFSPLENCFLPENLDGIYLGGGYPELYAKKLSENSSMRKDILKALSGNMPCIAECGGFMYLTEGIREGEFSPMAGLFPGKSFDTGKLVRFGYITLKARKDNLLCRKGESIKAHEFHHYDSEDPGDDFLAEKPSGKSWSCVHASDYLYAGYPHFHFYANPVFARNFYLAALSFQRKREKENGGPGKDMV